MPRTLKWPTIDGMLIATPTIGQLVAIDDEQVANGSIKSVDAKRNQFVISASEEGEEITLRFNRRTQFTLDGEESSVEEALKKGHEANVKHRDNLAIRVDATTQQP